MEKPIQFSGFGSMWHLQWYKTDVFWNYLTTILVSDELQGEAKPSQKFPPNQPVVKCQGLSNTTPMTSKPRTKPKTSQGISYAPNKVGAQQRYIYVLDKIAGRHHAQSFNSYTYPQRTQTNFAFHPTILDWVLWNSSFPYLGINPSLLHVLLISNLAEWENAKISLTPW
jgi:hypothetical protein